MPIPVVDLFAGPGGLGEGFSACLDNRDSSPFRVALSIEKDDSAHRTLELRSFFRELDSDARGDYYRYLRQEIDQRELFNRHVEAANAAGLVSWNATLGEVHRTTVAGRIEAALDGASEWVLLGGPPCQVYSLVGRSRIRGEDPAKYAADHRHFLYREYLQILADHAPAVFVFENVKGLLSSVADGQRTIDLILRDLADPAAARLSQHALKQPEYLLTPITDYSGRDADSTDAGDFVIRAERHGVPQARHRLIIVGIRKDLAAYGSVSDIPVLKEFSPVPVSGVIGGLPTLRGSVSPRFRTAGTWQQCLMGDADATVRWSDLSSEGNIEPEVLNAIQETLDQVLDNELGTGSDLYVSGTFSPESEHLRNWIFDSKLNGVLNHHARSHMPSDLQRYLFAACFALMKDRSPKLPDFPPVLLPAHRNAKSGSFTDRFRVQLWDRPATTITSHISKDGHYFIHPDPLQCRSLTVREAARLQTFPDNYYFEGNRTQQYVQVGNAVPPFLAYQIAEIVHQILSWKNPAEESQLPLATGTSEPVLQSV